ncbi:hypothetical protein Tco_0485654 [Tanacetum coccineum]
MSSMQEDIQCASSDNATNVDRQDFEFHVATTYKSYCLGKDSGVEENIIESIKEGPFIWETVFSDLLLERTEGSVQKGPSHVLESLTTFQLKKGKSVVIARGTKYWFKTGKVVVQDVSGRYNLRIIKEGPFQRTMQTDYWIVAGYVGGHNSTECPKTKRLQRFRLLKGQDATNASQESGASTGMKTVVVSCKLEEQVTTFDDDVG